MFTQKRHEINYEELSATKLKYLRCSESPRETAKAFGLRMLDTVETLVVVDVTLSHTYDTIRMHNGDYRGQVFYPHEEWDMWWEHAARSVELASKSPVAFAA